MPNRTIVPIIIAVALFMQSLDATILATSLPSMAVAFNVSPVRLHLAITAYMLSVAGFLPLSGWLADRYGARRVFRFAIVLFTIASGLCGLAQDLNMLLLARVLQGSAGAMMVPVGRLILVRSVSKAELIGAMTLMSMPALVGPMLGPPVGGLITEFASWRWIFWVNLPIGLAGFILVGIFVKEVPSAISRPFDFRGFVLSGIGLSATLFGLDTAATESMPLPVSLTILACGVPLLLLYGLHARTAPYPILDLKVLRVPTLAASMFGGSLFRIGLGALPFLLPLMLQEGFGFTPLHSGLVTLASSLGAFGTRGFTHSLLRRFGFRTVLITVSLVAAFFMASYGLFRATTPIAVMLVLLASGSVFRTLGFGSLNALAFADVPEEHASQATGFVFMAQRLSQTIGVALAAFVLHTLAHGGPLQPSGFSAAFFIIAFISGLSALVFLRLDAASGAHMSGHSRAPRDPEAH